MYIEGEVGDEDQIAKEEMSVVAGGTPAEFSRDYCKKLPLGDIGTWPSGGIILAAGGACASNLVKASQSEVEFLNQSDETNKCTTNSINRKDKTNRIREDIDYAYSIDKLLQLESWKSASSDVLLIIDSNDDPINVLQFLKEQSVLKKKYQEQLSNNKEKAQMPPSIIVALLLPPAQDHGPQWANAAQIFSTDFMYPGSIDLMLLMQSGDGGALSSNTISCMTSIVRCPVDFSAVCKHMSPFSAIHHAVGFVATLDGATNESNVGCLVDAAGLYDGDPSEIEQFVYCSYSIYSGPGGFSDGFCCDGDTNDSPRNIISQIIGQTHHAAPVANAGYGVAASNVVLKEESNSVWTVLANIPATMTDVLLRALSGADACWDVQKMEKELTALGDLRTAYVEAFPPPEAEKDRLWGT
jgi:hypothetical protein